jgi:hypothetical protein
MTVRERMRLNPERETFEVVLAEGAGDTDFILLSVLKTAIDKALKFHKNSFKI